MISLSAYITYLYLYLFGQSTSDLRPNFKILLVDAHSHGKNGKCSIWWLEKVKESTESSLPIWKGGNLVVFWESDGLIVVNNLIHSHLWFDSKIPINPNGEKGLAQHAD